MTRDQFFATLNRWAIEKIPFLFLVDFEELKPIVLRLDDLNARNILYDFGGVTNIVAKGTPVAANIQKHPVSFEEYSRRFQTVISHLERGDSFLTNLTINTPIQSNLSLLELFHQSVARYKLYFNDQFIFFSPEPFVRIAGGKIFSYPMKGTIDASLVGAQEIILNDRKEMAEHVTIVDLIRNDLSQVATEVKVKRFRYVDEIKTSQNRLLQVSSEVEGVLTEKYLQNFGDLIQVLLPAGSISGAPKKRTIEIIREAEVEPRGYYTGVCGLFDGANLDSCVMIRFIEKTNGVMYYRSGGGITTQSDARKEYDEAIDKIYVPVN